MVRLHRTIRAVAIAIGVAAQPLAAQSSASLTHTVTVTVPPRVKVQFGTVAVSPAVVTRQNSLNASTQGIALSVNATRAWVLSVGSTAATSDPRKVMRWSSDASGGFTNLTAAAVTVASGALSSQPKSAELFFRGAAASGGAKNSDLDQPPVVLTMTAP